MAFSTIDFLRYAPNTYSSPVGKADAELVMWMDSWNYDSSTRLGMFRERQHFESYTWIESIAMQEFINSRHSHYIIKNCRLGMKGDMAKLTKTSDVEFPDLPSFLTFLGAARDYIFEPLLMGGLTALATGENPTTGLTAAATTGQPISSARGRNGETSGGEVGSSEGNSSSTTVQPCRSYDKCNFVDPWALPDVSKTHPTGRKRVRIWDAKPKPPDSMKSYSSNLTPKG